MTEKQNQPREYDAVLGEQNLPKNAAVLGGIEGVKMRLAAEDKLIRMAALEDGMKYGEAGLELAIAALTKDKSPQVRQKARDLLEQRQNEPIVKAAIASNPQVFFQRIIAIFSGENFVNEFRVNNKFIRIYRGDITNLLVDAIVTSDSTQLTMTGSIGYRIKYVGGEEIYNQLRKIAPIPLGQVAVTTAGNLNAKAVFHPAVIDCSLRDSRSSPQVIKQVVRNCMTEMQKYKLETIAFPLLGTGGGLLNREMVGEAMLSQLKEELSKENQTVKEVAIALYGMTNVRALKF